MTSRDHADRDYVAQLEARVAELERPGKPKSQYTALGKPLANRCPRCHEERGGIGVRRWTRRPEAGAMRRGYRCATCGAKWTAVIAREERDGEEIVTTRIEENGKSCGSSPH